MANEIKDKTVVVNLVGASGSGKTTIAKRLSRVSDKYNAIQSYTTRPPRYEDEWGHTFIEEYTVHEVPGKDRAIINDITHTTLHRDNDMIAYFNSYSSGHHYFATDEQVIRGKANLYTVDANGANQVKDFYKDNDTVDVVTIYIQADEAVRAERLVHRNDTEHRLEQDRELFRVVQCDYVVSGNEDIDSVVETIDNLIKDRILG